MGCLALQSRMGTLGVVVLLPGMDDTLGVGQAGEPVGVKALIPEPPVEALNETVLGGLAGLDEIKRDFVGIRPGVQGLASELRSIVDRDLFGGPVPGDQLLEDA